MSIQVDFCPLFGGGGGIWGYRTGSVRLPEIYFSLVLCCLLIIEKIFPYYGWKSIVNVAFIAQKELHAFKVNTING